MSEKSTATLSIEGQDIELDIAVGSEHEKALDISKLRGLTGYVTMDEAFVNTASCPSAITFLDGEKGILRYRGYPIEELADSADFEEVSYLLVYGELPNAQQKAQFSQAINAHSQLSDFTRNMIKNFPKDAHPMGVLSACLVALSSQETEFLAQDISEEQRDKAIAMLMGQTKAISAAFYRYATGQSETKSGGSAGFSEDFQGLMFEKNDPELTSALNTLLILHADHEQNCSTASVRLVGSSKANPFATAASGVNALWGPLHGGANQAVIEMLQLIQDNGGDTKQYLAKAKDKADPFKLMGFGHRVYKNFDPRSKIIKKSCDKILSTLGVNDPLLEIAKGLEEEALRDQYFIDRKLYPNVDFYSGIIYKALNIPTNMFTVMFALGRMPGWLAQWREMMLSPTARIGRPRQVYVGEPMRHFKPMNER